MKKWLDFACRSHLNHTLRRAETHCTCGRAVLIPLSSRERPFPVEQTAWCHCGKRYKAEASVRVYVDALTPATATDTQEDSATEGEGSS
jgi:hypothetical protein